jgi:transposase InsO family protein
MVLADSLNAPFAPGETMDTKLSTLAPRDHAEEVAHFRAQVLGPVLATTLGRGELMARFRELAQQRFVPPGSPTSRTFAVATLQRWHYAFKHDGIDGLLPVPRSDRGAAQKLTEEQRELICAIRREHQSASAELIVRTLEQDGRIDKGAISPSSVRRLFLERGLDRVSLRQSDAKERRRWAAASVDELWHADVCHGPALTIGGRSVPLRIHALLDDKSRYIVAIQATHNEREQEMLALVVKALRRYHPPKTLYLDNGATYSGQTLRTVCTRLGIHLLHARPYDPQARGKMERFWRTLREGCLDHLRDVESLHDVQIRLLAFLDTHYLIAPHSSLVGKTPALVYDEERSREPSAITEAQLAAALTVHARRRVKRDGTVEIGGVVFETRAGFLAGRIVEVARSLLDTSSLPWIEHEGARYELAPVDPVKNGRRARRPNHRPKAGLDLDFNPNQAALDVWSGRAGRGGAQ